MSAAGAIARSTRVTRSTRRARELAELLEAVADRIIDQALRLERPSRWFHDREVARFLISRASVGRPLPTLEGCFRRFGARRTPSRSSFYVFLEEVRAIRSADAELVELGLWQSER